MDESAGTRLLAIVVAAGLAVGCGHDPRVAARFSAQVGILAPASIGGAEGMFLLDTGSDQTLVTPSVSSRLQATGRTKNAYSRPCVAPSPAEVFRSGEIRFAGGRLRYPAEVSVLALAELGGLLQQDLGGILGWDVLHSYVIGIDIPGGRLMAGRELSAAELLERLGARKTDAKLPLKITGNRPAVVARSGDHDLLLLLDTGSGKTLLSAAAWRRMNRALQDGPPSQILDINGTFSTRTGLLGDLSLGALRLENVSVAVSADPACAEEDTPGIDGLLGRDVLSRFLVAIDGPAEVLHLAELP